jgi:uncharacterized protein (TIGR03435 family)
MRIFKIASFIALLSGAAVAQTPDSAPAPAFDIADVHASPRTLSANPFMTGGVLRGTRYDLRNATMVDLIHTAWNIDADTVFGGPNWLETDRFDIVAKAPANTPAATLRLMLQALLADRFKLQVHNDTRPMPAFALTLGKGKPKMKESDGSGMGCQPVPQNSEPSYIVISCHNVTMDALVRNLRLMANSYLPNIVVDQTGLQGAWDFELKWTNRAQLTQAGSDAITIFDAIDKQLGLKLGPAKVPSPVLVVDHVNEKPTENSPDVARELPPPPPPEFEVATIKPSAPDTKPNGNVLPGGRVSVQGVPLKMLIDLAWNISSDDMIVGMPKFAGSARFDLTAKASSAVGSGTGPSIIPQVDIDDVRQMLQALLIERFQMKTHMEERPVTAYSLVAVKPKLTQADPTNRTRWKEGPGPEGKDPRNSTPILSRLVTCQNMTMAQFADLLQKIAPGYIHTPVLDETGLEGAYDFTLSFSAAGLLQQNLPGRGGDATPTGAAPASAVPSASDPNGALSLFDAISKQLGLKLEERKRPVPVLVIDHMEEKPTEN